MRYEVKTPVRTYNGYSAGVPFSQGIGYTENEDTVKWFISKGYTVTPMNTQPVEEVEEVIEEVVEEIPDPEEVEDVGEEDVTPTKPRAKVKIKK